MVDSIDIIEIAREYIRAIEGGATGDALAAYFDPDVVQEEFPNRIVPNGARRDLAALLEGAVRGQQVLRSQRMTILNAIQSGDTVALEVLWEGTLAITIGSLNPGDVMRAHSAMFIQFRNGKIIAQRNYDCFEKDKG